MRPALRLSTDWQFVAFSLLVMLGLQLIGPEWFRFQSDWFASGEIWRVISAHWVHVGWMHLGLNAAGLMICVSITAPGWSKRQWLLVTLSMALGISLLFTWRNPEINWYVGFSGVLFGLYFLAAVEMFARDRLIATLVVVAIVGKVMIEQFSSFDLTSAELIGAPVLVDAHFYGVILAFAIALLKRTYTMNQRTKQQSNRDDAKT